MGKSRTPLWYENIVVGERITAPGARKLSDAERAHWIQFTGDTLSRYTDDAGRVHPLILFNLAHGMLSDVLHHRATEELGVSHLMIHRQSSLGNIIRMTARIIGVREDPNHRAGVVWVRVAARDIRGVVLSYVHWFRLPKQHQQSRVPRDALPRLATNTRASEIPLARFESLPPAPGRFGWEDYTASEQIFHGGERCADGALIRSFSRFFGYTPVHHHSPEPIAPSGLAIGLAYSLIVDGLSLRSGTGAIIALRTPNPVRSGDQLRAMSQIVSIAPLSDALVAIRSRLFLFRNHNPQSSSPPQITAGKHYYSHIALDMDYWEIVKK